MAEQRRLEPVRERYFEMSNLPAIPSLRDGMTRASNPVWAPEHFAKGREIAGSSQTRVISRAYLIIKTLKLCPIS